MGEESKKFLLIGFAIAAVVVAGTVLYKSTSGGGTSKNVNQNAGVALKCPDCGGFEVSLEEFNNILRNSPSGAMPTQPMIIDCPKCSKHICQVAEKCPKCGNIFFSGEAKDSKFADRCPKCGFSPLEDRIKK